MKKVSFVNEGKCHIYKWCYMFFSLNVFMSEVWPFAFSVQMPVEFPIHRQQSIEQECIVRSTVEAFNALRSDYAGILCM